MCRLLRDFLPIDTDQDTRYGTGSDVNRGRTDICEQELIVGATGTPVHNNSTQTTLSLYQQQYFMYVYNNNFNQNCTRDIKNVSLF